MFTGICTPIVHCGGSGKEFVFAPMPNDPTYNHVIGVILQAASNENIHVNIFVRGIGLDVNITLSTESGLHDNPLPNSLIYQNVTGSIDSTVVITSDKDIFVLSYNMAIHSSDVFTINSKQNLGQEYFVATMTWEDRPDLSGVISISASEYKTYIEIFLNSTIEFENNQFYAGDIIRYTLLPYETMQLLPLFGNITGSRILANASVAVSVGAKCVNVPSNVGSCDHIAEQLAPFTAWGKMFVISPLASRTSGYVLQITAGRDNTTVSYNSVTVQLNMGHFVTVDIRSQEMIVVSADKPISIMQYSTGGRQEHISSGDPSMMRVVPIEQYVTMAIFPVYQFSPNITEVRHNYLGITSRCEYMEDITFLIDGTPVTVSWK